MAATVNLLARAAALVPPGDRGQAGLLVELADAYLKAGQFERARAAAITAGETAQLRGDRALQARSSIVRLQLRSYVDPVVGLRDLQAETTQAIETLTAAGDDAGLAHGWTFAAYLWLSAGQAARMEEAIDRATGHARRAGDRRAELDALFLAPMINHFGPRPREAGIVRCRELLERSRGARHVDGFTLIAWGLLAGMGGDMDEGRRLAEEGRGVADDDQAASAG